ncbi:MAG: hypothetical protein ACK4XY_11775 [Chloroherpetonaceae bacterium]
MQNANLSPVSTKVTAFINETIARLERDLSQAPTELDKACAASRLAWQLRLVDSVRAITLSDETAESLQICSLSRVARRKMWAESRGKNQGATFFVELPAYQAA